MLLLAPIIPTIIYQIWRESSNVSYRRTRTYLHCQKATWGGRQLEGGGGSVIFWVTLCAIFLTPMFLMLLFCTTGEIIWADIKMERRGMYESLCTKLWQPSIFETYERNFVPYIYSIFRFFLEAFKRVSGGGILWGYFFSQGLTYLNTLHLISDFIPKRTRPLYMSKNI